jgi:Cu-processing system permease protein
MNILSISQIVIKELYRRKDFYVLFILTALITLLLGSVNMFNDDKIVRFLKEICLLLIWIASFVIGVTMTARQIPTERESRTIFPLLAKPVSRAELIIGKFFGCWFASGIALVVFYVFFSIVVGLREQTWPALSYFQAVWLHWVLLAVIIAMALLGSLVFAAPSSNATIIFVVVIGILFTGRHLHRLALQMSEPLSTIISAVYFAMPHLEFFDIRDLVIHNLDLISWMNILLATVYGFFYTTIFLILTWLRFRRQGLT